MPHLRFHIVDVEPVFEGVTPLLRFGLDVENESAEERIESILLQAQVRIEPARRTYDAGERERLAELFGPPEDWGRTLHSLLWTHTGTVIPPFRQRSRGILAVPCTFDLNVAAAKYLYGVDDGEVVIPFLFTGTVFYRGAEDRLLVERISRQQESMYRLPVATWKNLMQHHYPNKAWVYLERDVFDELYAFRRKRRLGTWEAVIDHLLRTVREDREAA